MERVGGRQEKMEGHCWTGQSPQWAAVSMEEKEEEEDEEMFVDYYNISLQQLYRKGTDSRDRR